MTVVRLAGLLADPAYAASSAGDITSAVFYMKDGGSSSAVVNIHAITSNSTWTEAGVKYENLGSYSPTVTATDTMGSANWGEFDITNLVRSWKTGANDAQCGFAMVIGDSTKKIGTLSSEYSNTDYRPYVVVQYHADEITLEEGKTLQLNTGITGAVTWSTSDTSRASVSSTGLVTGIRAGEVTITATFGSNETTSFPVYVTVPSGVYYIKNASSGLCLQGTVGQIHINSQKASQDTRIDQLWKITYWQNGQ